MDKAYIDSQKTELLSLIDHLKADDYALVTDKHKAYVQPIMDDIIKNLRTDETAMSLFVEIYGRMSSLSEKYKAQNAEIEKNFNLNAHFRELVSKIGNISAEDAAKHFDLSAKVNGISGSMLLYSTNREMLPSAERDEYCRQAERVFSKLVSEKGEPNASLAKAVGDRKLKFQIIDSNKFDGRFAAEELHNRGELVIELTKGCFAADKINDFPMLLAHESGHLLDTCMRPAGYRASQKEGEEYLADICGARMCENAGYSHDGFARFLEAEGQRSKDGTLLLKRAEILRQLPQAKSNVRTADAAEQIFAKIGRPGGKHHDAVRVPFKPTKFNAAQLRTMRLSRTGGKG